MAQGAIDRGFDAIFVSDDPLWEPSELEYDEASAHRARRAGADGLSNQAGVKRIDLKGPEGSAVTETEERAAKKKLTDINAKRLADRRDPVKTTAQLIADACACGRHRDAGHPATRSGGEAACGHRDDA
jgi:hypothetical protein